MKDPDSSQIGVRLQIDARHRLETLARLSGIPLSELVRRAVATYVSKGQQAWVESKRARENARRLRGRVDSVPLDVKLFGRWLLSRPADLRRLLIELGDDLRSAGFGRVRAGAHVQLLDVSPLGGWTAEFLEPVPTDISPSAQTDLILRRARIVEASQSLIEMLGAAHSDDVIGHPLAAFLNLADPETFEAICTFAENGHCMLGAHLAAVDPHGRAGSMIASAIGRVDNGRLVKLRGVAQRAVPSDESGTPDGLETHLPQGLWCLSFDPPIATDMSPGQQVEAICTHGQWLWCNGTFANLCGLDDQSQLQQHPPSTMLPMDEMPNRECFELFVASGYRLRGRECFTRTTDERIRKGRLRMTGQIVDRQLLRLYGCYEDLTHLLAPGRC
jgi:PAS domain-containing protein